MVIVFLSFAYWEGVSEDSAVVDFLTGLMLVISILGWAPQSGGKLLVLLLDVFIGRAVLLPIAIPLACELLL